MNVLNKTRVYEEHKRFKYGCEAVDDDKPSRHSSTSTSDENVEKVNEMVRNDR